MKIPIGRYIKCLCLLYVVFTYPLSAASLTWTAPGDDGNVGTATEYDLRISDVPITEGNWDSCVQIEGEPVPSVAGTQESYEFYFAIKTVDEAGNWSLLSNVVVVPYDCDNWDPMRGDFDCSGQLDISDLMMLIDYMFVLMRGLL